MKKTAWKPLIGAVAAGLALSGCATGGTAATVDGKKISESQVDDTLAACEEAGFPLIQTGANSRGTVVFSLAAGEAARANKELQQYAPDQSQIDQMLAELPPEIQSQPVCKAYFEGTLLFNQTFDTIQKAAPDQLRPQLSKTLNTIEPNPKYGRLKTDDQGAVTMQSGSMSTRVGPQLMGN